MGERGIQYIFRPPHPLSNENSSPLKIVILLQARSWGGGGGRGGERVWEFDPFQSHIRVYVTQVYIV